MSQIKGFAIRGVLKYVKEKQSAKPGEVIANLPAELAAAFKHPIVTSSWYPYPVFSTLLRQVDRQFGKGDLKLCIDLGDFAARQDIAGIFKMMLSVLDPDTLLRRSTVFWAKYSDTGKIGPLPAAPHRYAIRLDGFRDMDEAHCYLMIGWMTRLGLYSKATTVDMKHTFCVNRGADFCQWEGTWKT
jgi:hypothetical protein